MKLTQKELAALANVSTPTVSRFELAAKDVQLSSALAISRRARHDGQAHVDLS